MKRMSKRFICVLLAVILVAVTFSSCSGKEKMIDFIYPFSADVNSFDPQVAGTTDIGNVPAVTNAWGVSVDENGKLINE